MIPGTHSEEVHDPPAHTLKKSNVTNPNSNEYKLTAIVLHIAGHRLFKPVGIKKDETVVCQQRS
jgi:hypothetical protein